MSAPPSPVNGSELQQHFLNGMSNAACTVSVVTTDGPTGRSGVTVSAMTSVSADMEKPTLLVCIHRLSPAAAAIMANGVFCVNILRDDQSYISDCFAGKRKTSDGDKFSCTQWALGGVGAPRVVDALVAFDCRLLFSQQIGTHYVLFGEVEEIFSAGPGSPLIYANRAYGSPSRIGAISSGDNGTSSNGRLNLGVLHTFAPYVVPEILERFAIAGDKIELKLLEGNQRAIVEGLQVGEVDIALLYDLGLGEGIHAERLAALDPYVLLAENDPLAKHTSLLLAELSQHPLILLDAPPSGDYFLSLFRKKNLTPKIRLHSTSFEMVRGLVGRGMGYSLLATKPASNMSYDGHALTTRPLRDELPPSYIALAKRIDGKSNPAADLFAEQCRIFFRAFKA